MTFYVKKNTKKVCVFFVFGKCVKSFVRKNVSRKTFFTYVFDVKSIVFYVICFYLDFFT
jgi:hypothetical protein